MLDKIIGILVFAGLIYYFYYKDQTTSSSSPSRYERHYDNHLAQGDFKYNKALRKKLYAKCYRDAKATLRGQLRANGLPESALSMYTSKLRAACTCYIKSPKTRKSYEDLKANKISRGEQHDIALQVAQDCAFKQMKKSDDPFKRVKNSFKR